MTCRDCALFDLDACKDKAGRVLRHRSAKCLWQSTEQWPISVRPWISRRPIANLTEPGEGKDCPCFIKREVGK